MLKQFKRRDNDTAGLGTAAHEGFRYTCEHTRLGDTVSLELATDAAQEAWSEIWANEATHITEIATEREGLILVADVMRRWWHEIWLPYFADAQILEVEQPFTVLVYEDEYRCIYLQGTYDLRVPRKACDWKTSNKAYSGRDAWKYQRHYSSVQHIVYPWAIDVMLGLDPLAGAQSRRTGDHQLSHSFTYFVIPREPKGASIPSTDSLQIRPTVSDCAFLLEEMLGWCYLIEAELPQWPLGPTDWWCSSKWCPAWDQCRGLHHGPDPWGLVQRMTDNLNKKGYKANGK